MKKIIIPIVLCVVAVGVALYVLNSGDHGSGRSPDAARLPAVPAVEPAAADANTAAAAQDGDGHGHSDLAQVVQREPGALTDPLPVGVARVDGGAVLATVQVGAKFTPELSPNQVGAFPRVYVKKRQKVVIRLRFPDAQPGGKAAVSVEDGGFLADNKPAIPLVLDEKREGEFEFTTGAAFGQYRVVVRQGADTRILVLWAEA